MSQNSVMLVYAVIGAWSRNLLSNHSLQCRVRSRNLYGMSGYSNAICFPDPEACPKSIAPSDLWYNHHQSSREELTRIRIDDSMRFHISAPMHFCQLHWWKPESRSRCGVIHTSISHPFPLVHIPFPSDNFPPSPPHFRPPKVSRWMQNESSIIERYRNL